MKLMYVIICRKSPIELKITLHQNLGLQFNAKSYQKKKRETWSKGIVDSSEIVKQAWGLVQCQQNMGSRKNMGSFG